MGYRSRLKTIKNAEQLIDDTKIVRDNIGHIIYLTELVPKDMDFMINFHVNPHTGEFLDENYRWNNGFVFRRHKGLLSACEECRLDKRARQNISNTFYEYVYSYL